MKHAMVFSEEQLDEAFEWVCKQRIHHPSNADIWHLRFHWVSIKPQLLNSLRSKSYCFSPMQRIVKRDGSIIHMWSSQDSLVLKVLTNMLSCVLPINSTLC